MTLNPAIPFPPDPLNTEGVPVSTPAHDQQVINHYVLHFPNHSPRPDDPHYAAFNAYHRAHEKTSSCYIGTRIGFDQCADAQGLVMLDQPGHPGLELHHNFLEFAVINSVDLKALEVDYPNLTDPDLVAAWAETDPNFIWYCPKHHRGIGGAHHAAHADFEASIYIRDLISPSPKGLVGLSLGSPALLSPEPGEI